jgi:hypothetical protein
VEMFSVSIVSCIAGSFFLWKLGLERQQRRYLISEIAPLVF